MNIFNSVFVDCTASGEIASLYRNFVGHGISVVAANKITASSDYDAYASLKDLARSKGVKFLFETNVGSFFRLIVGKGPCLIKYTSKAEWLISRTKRERSG